MKIWKDKGVGWKFCVVRVGRRKNLIVIYFSIVVLLDVFGVYVLSGLEFRLCFTLILSQTLTNSGWAGFLIRLMLRGTQFGLGWWVNSGITRILSYSKGCGGRVWSVCFGASKGLVFDFGKIRSASFSYSNWCLELLVCMRMFFWSFFSGLLISLVVFVRCWFLYHLFIFYCW